MTVRLIADALGVSVSFLLGETVEPSTIVNSAVASCNNCTATNNACQDLCKISSFSDGALEIARIYDKINFRAKAKLMSYAYEMEDAE